MDASDAIKHGIVLVVSAIASIMVSRARIRKLEAVRADAVRSAKTDDAARAPRVKVDEGTLARLTAVEEQLAALKKHRDGSMSEIDIDDQRRQRTLAEGALQRSEFAEHVQSEADRWNATNRTLGNIEGTLAAIKEQIPRRR